MIYIIAYDIADNKRRLRVAKTLESWGYRGLVWFCGPGVLRVVGCY